MGSRIKILGAIPEGAEGMSVRGRFSPEATEDVQGQGWRIKGLAQTEDDTEGQGARWGLAQSDDDTEGQGGRFSGLSRIDDDSEGHWIRVKIEPDEVEDSEGRGGRYNGLVPVEADDAEGNVLNTHVLDIEKDENGELVGRYVPADDTKGQGGRYSG
jgi:hypothetical protein